MARATRLSWSDSCCPGGHRRRRRRCRPSYLVQHTDDYTTPHFSVQGSIIEHTLPTIHDVIDQKTSNLPCMENYSTFSHIRQEALYMSASGAVTLHLIELVIYITYLYNNC